MKYRQLTSETKFCKNNKEKEEMTVCWLWFLLEDFKGLMENFENWVAIIAYNFEIFKILADNGWAIERLVRFHAFGVTGIIWLKFCPCDCP